MIAKLIGKVDEIGASEAIILTNGIGYRVFLTKQGVLTLSEGSDVTLEIYHAIRETAQDLYGFLNKEELDFFKLLITISGIGPKGAMSILNTSPVETIKQGISTGDASQLTKVSGIGKKSAEKIVLALKDKIGIIEGQGGSHLEESSMAIEALTSLGYSGHESRKAIQQVDRNLSTEKMIKEALKNIGSNAK